MCLLAADLVPSIWGYATRLSVLLEKLWKTHCWRLMNPKYLWPRCITKFLRWKLRVRNTGNFQTNKYWGVERSNSWLSSPKPFRLFLFIRIKNIRSLRVASSLFSHHLSNRSQKIFLHLETSILLFVIYCKFQNQPTNM